MKSAPAALTTFLENTTTFARADLYTFTLNGGAVLRWNNSGAPITASIQVGGATTGPYKFLVGPPIEDAGVQSARGVQASTVDVTVLGGDGRFTVGGADVIDFIYQRGLDGALARIDRAFAASASDMATIGPVGTYCRFSGRVKEVKELGSTQAVVGLTDFRDSLSQQYPKETFQTSCNNAFGDSNCGVSLAALTKTGTVQNTGETLTDFQSTLTDASFYWNLGSVLWLTGKNAGLSRSIKQYDSVYGTVSMSAPLPTPPVAGDTFKITPGCPLSTTACQGWQSAVPAPAPSWQKRFRGYPFIPPPTTGLPT